ncbi:MFS transporter [Schleiferiaceae bacterium]|jgi:MFS family permease|nr:MFS transporter [Schleiferiaceae bacterium]
MSNATNRRALFVASCASLLVTSLSFGIRAGILNDLGVEFELNTSELSRIAATAFWGFPVSMIIGGAIVDKVGMKNLMRLAYLGHFAGILLTIFAGGFWSLWTSTLLIGLANGMVEAVCNPLVASVYPEEKTTKLNQFHLWFPGGIVIGTLVAFAFGKIGLNWQWMMAVMLIPTIWYAVWMERLEFPVTERVANRVSDRDMYSALLNPLFLIITVAMLGTATAELFINQWVDVLLRSVSNNAILILLITSGVMTLGRGMAATIVSRFSTTGMLLFSAVFTTIGLFMMANLDGNLLFLSAVVFGIGVTYFWPTMLGFVATYIPKTGAIGLAIVGAAGMFAVSIYTQIMGGYYDGLTAKLSEVDAGRAVIRTTLYIPIALIVIFAGIHLYMKQRKEA